MATKTSIVCDICGTVKGETNHWFIVDIRKEDKLENDPGFHIVQANFIKREHLDLEEAKDVCGQTCAMKLFSQWMTDAQTAQETSAVDDSKVHELPEPL